MVNCGGAGHDLRGRGHLGCDLRGCSRAGADHRSHGDGSGSVGVGRSTRRGSRCRIRAASSAGAIDSGEADDNALGLTSDGLVVEVVIAVVVDGAGVEDVAAVVLEVPLAINAKPWSRAGTGVALELRGRGSQDTAAAIAVHDLAILDAEGRGGGVVGAGADLAVVELADGTVGGTIAVELEAAFLRLTRIHAKRAGLGDIAR